MRWVLVYVDLAGSINSVLTMKRSHGFIHIEIKFYDSFQDQDQLEHKIHFIKVFLLSEIRS